MSIPVHEYMASITAVNVNLPSWLCYFIDTWSQWTNFQYMVDNNATRSNCKCLQIDGIVFFDIHR